MPESKRPTREQLIELYVTKALGVRAVAAACGVSTAFVRKELRRHGIELRPIGREKRVCVDGRTAEAYRRMYHDEQKSVRECARELGVCTDVVMKDLALFGIPTRPVSPTSAEYVKREHLGVHAEPTEDKTTDNGNKTDRSSSGTVKHRGLDTSFFETIDSEVKAYALGLLWSDGSISTTQWTMRIRLEEGDAPALEAIREAMQAAPLTWSPPNPKSKGKTPTVLLQVNSKEIVQQLQWQGFCENKSQRLPRVTLPPLELERAFVRGLIDGDGSLYRPDYPTISFYNMNPYLRSIVIDCWERITGKRPPTYIPVTVGKARGRVNEIGERAQSIAHALYLEHATVFLPRKRARAEEFQAWARNPKKKTGT